MDLEQVSRFWLVVSLNCWGFVRFSDKAFFAFKRKKRGSGDHCAKRVIPKKV